jgi:cysteine desulfurase
MKYLDYNATTPVHKDVLAEMLPYFSEKFANPASRTHEMGREANQVVEEARAKLAAIFNLDSKYVIFTSGATEANNLVILGLKKYMKESGKTKIVTSMFEHKAVLDPCQHLADDEGFEIVYVRPQPNGVIDPEDFKKEIDEKTGLVSLMHVNNELGTVQPVLEVAKYAKEKGAMMHVDGAQGFCKTKLQLEDKIDYYTASAHKIFGPKGIGCLFINGRKARKPLRPIMFGGGHEGGLRSGTLPTPLIVGFAAASDICRKEFRKSRKSKVEKVFQEILEKYPQAELNIPADELGTTINFRVPGVKSEALLLREKEWALSNGSACTSRDYSPSHVLRSIGMVEDTIKESIRLSII